MSNWLRTLGGQRAAKRLDSAVPFVPDDESVFRHKSLTSARSFRILNLVNSNKSTELECTLSEENIDRPSQMYEAVSYTWNNQPLDRIIICDGKKMAITANCESLLKCFRKHRTYDTPTQRRLWIDAICINQCDTSECSQQVQLMGDIYSNCKRVLVWLGEPTKNSDRCIKAMKKYIMACFYSQALPTVLGSMEPRAQAKLTRFFEEYTNEIQDVLFRFWFRRVWTIQEVAFCPEVRAFCGDQAIDWVGLVSVIVMNLPRSMLQTTNLLSYTEVFEQFRLHMEVRHRVGEKMITTQEMVNIMEKVRISGASKAQDKIFALQSVFLSVGIVMPTVDYTRSLGLIYRDATAALIKHTSSLQLLTLNTGTGTNCHDRPSWTPDYNEKLPPWPAFNHAFAATSGSEKSYFSVKNDGSQLKVDVIAFDKVKEVSKLKCWHPDRSLDPEESLVWLTMSSNAEATVTALQDWQRIARTTGKIYQYTGQPIGDALLGTLGGADRSGLDANKVEALRRELYASPTSVDTLVVPSSEEGKIWGAALSLKLGQDISSLAPIFAKASRNSLLKRKFGAKFDFLQSKHSDSWKIMAALSTMTDGIFDIVLMSTRKNIFMRTKKGYIGYGSYAIQNGDLVVLIPGVNTPMALRPTGDGIHHRLVAPIYVHGIMGGEAYADIMDRIKSEPNATDEELGIVNLVLV